MTLELHVPDITCGHCKMHIEKAVGVLPGVEAVEVNVERKTVHVKGDVQRAVVERVIRELGYTI